MGRLGAETVDYQHARTAWGELSNTLRSSQGFSRIAISVLTEKGKTVEQRLSILDEIGAKYFPAGDSADHFRRMRGQIDVDGSAVVCASEMFHTFVRFGVPCNYGLVGYVVDALPELQTTGKVTVTPEAKTEVNKIIGLAARVSIGSE